MSTCKEKQHFNKWKFVRWKLVYYHFLLMNASPQLNKISLIKMWYYLVQCLRAKPAFSRMIETSHTMEPGSDNWPFQQLVYLENSHALTWQHENACIVSWWSVNNSVLSNNWLTSLQLRLVGHMHFSSSEITMLDMKLEMLWRIKTQAWLQFLVITRQMYQ